MESELEINVGDFFVSTRDKEEEIFIYVSAFSCGPSELKENWDYAEYYGLTFLNGKQRGKTTWREKEEIILLLEKNIWKRVPKCW